MTLWITGRFAPREGKGDVDAFVLALFFFAARHDHDSLASTE